MFNAESFLNATTKNATSTVTKPVPPGEYVGQISDLKVRQNRDGSAVLDVLWEIPDANLQEELKRKKIITRQSIWLDLTPNGDLDEAEGTNVALGKLRKAVGQNEAGQEWSPLQLIGQVAKINVVEDVNKETNDILDRVKSVLPMD
jgi:hypothetical protein